jgi:hypothetical protein
VTAAELSNAGTASEDAGVCGSTCSVTLCRNRSAPGVRLTVMLTRRSLIRFAAALPVASAAIPVWGFGSKDFWETKPPSDWNSEEVEKMITKSPWAKEVTVASGNRMGNPGNRGGGRPRGGIGFPGGGIGFPGGGGYPGGGGGYPGGGGPYPGGGGRYPGGGRGGGQAEIRVAVRWESAAPVQDALHLHDDGEKPDPDFEKYYVIALIVDLPSGRPRDEDSDGTKDHDDRRLEEFKSYTHLERKDGPLHLEKVEEGSRTGARGPGVYFYFSRKNELSLDDKELDFSTKVGTAEIKAKFTLKDMRYHGKLAV